jgi:putative FmdB family regulatory protein
MPIYDFKCPVCGLSKEVFVPITAYTVECPACQGAMRRLPSAPMFILNGGCWAKDGYSSHKAGKEDGCGDNS